MRRNKILTFTVPGKIASSRKRKSAIRYQSEIKTAAIVAARRKRWKIVEDSQIRLEILLHCNRWEEIPSLIGVLQNVRESIKGILIGDNWSKIVREILLSVNVDGQKKLQITAIEL